MSERRLVKLLSEEEVIAKLKQDDYHPDTKLPDLVYIARPFRQRQLVKPGPGVLNTDYGPKFPTVFGLGLKIDTFYLHHHNNFPRHVHMSVSGNLHVTRTFETERGKFPPRGSSPHSY